jgi:hypothetical protein
MDSRIEELAEIILERCAIARGWEEFIPFSDKAAMYQAIYAHARAIKDLIETYRARHPNS